MLWLLNICFYFFYKKSINSYYLFYLKANNFKYKKEHQNCSSFLFDIVAFYSQMKLVHC